MESHLIILRKGTQIFVFNWVAEKNLEEVRPIRSDWNGPDQRWLRPGLRHWQWREKKEGWFERKQHKRHWGLIGCKASVEGGIKNYMYVPASMIGPKEMALPRWGLENTSRFGVGVSGWETDITSHLNSPQPGTWWVWRVGGAFNGDGWGSAIHTPWAQGGQGWRYRPQAFKAYGR